jgi:hypothetical protein
VGNRAIKSSETMNRLLQAWIGIRKVATPNAQPLQLRVGADANSSVISVMSPKGYGAPTVMITTPLGFRQVGDDWRFPGIGTMIMGHVGQSLLVTWGMQRAVEVGSGLCDEVAFFEGMSGGNAKAREYMNSTAHWCSIGPGDIAWVPYGMHVWLIGEQHISAVIAQPFFDHDLAGKVDVKLWSAIKAAILQLNGAREAEPVKYHIDALIVFLESDRKGVAASGVLMPH